MNIPDKVLTLIESLELTYSLKNCGVEVIIELFGSRKYFLSQSLLFNGSINPILGFNGFFLSKI